MGRVWRQASIGLQNRAVIWIGIILMLSACSTPRNGVPAPIEAGLVETVDVMTTEPELAELPVEDAAPRRRGVMGFLRRQPNAVEPVTVATSDAAEDETPIAPALSEEELAALGVVETEDEEAARTRLFAGMFKRRAEPLTEPVFAPASEVALPETGDPAGPNNAPSPEEEALPVAVETASVAEDRPRGLRGLFRRNKDREEAQQADLVLAAAPPQDEDVILETAPEMPGPPQVDAPPGPRLRAWPFGRANRPSSPELARPEFQTSPGSLPFGQVVEACGVKKRDLGAQVAKAGGYKLFDTAPESITPRAQYLTGFGVQDDLCQSFGATNANSAATGGPWKYTLFNFDTLCPGFGFG